MIKLPSPPFAIALLLATLVLTPIAAEEGKTTSSPTLFDGKSLAGWHKQHEKGQHGTGETGASLRTGCSLVNRTRPGREMAACC